MRALENKKGLLLVLAIIMLGCLVVLYHQYTWVEVYGIVYREGGKLDFIQKAVVAASVINESEEHRIDPRLTLAIIKQESHFQPGLKSAAGALGLMQLEPVAVQELDPSQTDLNEVAKRLQGDLAYNIHYGVAYFKSLIDHYDGHLGWALEAYNEGPTAVNSRYDGKAMKLAGYPAAVLAIYHSFEFP